MKNSESIFKIIVSMFCIQIVNLSNLHSVCDNRNESLAWDAGDVQL
jgi:hypothetical protein